MPIILTRNLVGRPVVDFAVAVKAMAKEQSGNGSFNFIYIVPTRRRVRELQRELVQDVCFGKLPIYTLELFAHEIFNSLSTGRRIISPSMQGMIVSRILSDGDFKFFKFASVRPGTRKGVAPAGTIKKIVDHITYLEENGITPQDYRTMLAAAEDAELEKLTEFLSIYSEYLNRLGTDILDSTSTLALVNRELEQSGDLVSRLYPGKRTVFVEGFYDFKKPELDFLRILSRFRNFSFSIRLDCTGSNPNLFKTMLATSSELTKRGFASVSDLEGSPDDEVDRLRKFLGEHLFGETTVRKLDLTNRAFVAGARDKLGEAEYVAEKIKEIMKRFPDQQLHRIGVVSYLPQNYSTLFREVFRKYRIPSNVTDRLTLESNGVVNAILSFVDISITDYERRSMLRALSNRALSISDGFDSSRAGSIIRRAAALCRFERGRETFKEAIKARLEFLRKLGPEDTEDNTEKIAKDIETLGDASRILSSIETKLDRFDKDMTQAEFRHEMRLLVDRLEIQRNIVAGRLDNMFTDLAERDVRALSSFFEVLDELVEVEGGSGKLPAAVWMDYLRSALSLTRYNVRQKYGYGVYVTSLEEIRGLEFDYLFIVGLNEGELPARYDPEILLPVNTQRENRAMKPYLQRHLFYQAVSSFRKELFLVHPVRKKEIRLARSSFIDALLDIAEVSEINQGVSGEHVHNIYNAHQLIEAYSLSIGNRERITAHEEARNLLPTNVERCMSAESARLRDLRDSEFNGKVTDGELIKILDAELSRRVFSSSQVESLSRCGFQFFTRRILGIIENLEIETSMSPIERGAVLHKILYRFYTELDKKGKTASAEKEIGLLRSIGKEVLEEFGISPIAPEGMSSARGASRRSPSSAYDLFEVEKDIILGTDYVPGTLDLFLSKVQAKLSEYGFVPEKFELSFGTQNKDSDDLSTPVKIGDVALRGKIDRIDSDNNGFLIFDYKTSSALPTHRDVVADKISPQLLIYVAALDEMLHTAAEKKPVIGAAYISINREKLMKATDGKEGLRFIVVDEDGELKYNETYGSTAKTRTGAYPNSMSDLLNQTGEFVSRAVKDARSGKFNLTKFSWDRVCKFCAYSHACRIALRGEAGEELAGVSESS